MTSLWRAKGTVGNVLNALTVDVEDYFQVEAFAGAIQPQDWGAWPPRVDETVSRILDLLAARGCRATFFTLGWIAARHPALIRRIVAGGHELASHGHAHQRADRQAPAVFRDDVRRARQVLEDVGGTAVRGYRAPCFSINGGNLWALDILAEEGYRYSSSVYPIRHDLYGMPEAPRQPFRPRPSGIVEIPVATARLWGTNLPCGGGGYFRLFPYAVSRRLLRAAQAEGRPSVFYFHPWEIDPDQPRPTGLSLRSRLRHYLNLARTEPRLERLLGDFAWDRMDRVFEAFLTRG